MSPATAPTTPDADGLFQLTLRPGAAEDRTSRPSLDAWRERVAHLVTRPAADAPWSAPWLDLEAAQVPATTLERVPRGPTLVLGFGGSALGTRAAIEAARRAGLVKHELRVLDTVDPETVREDLEWAASVGAKVHVISKSGRTDEVRVLLDAVMARDLGPDVLISDPGERPFDALIASRGGSVLRLEIPPPVGGRYSIFTAVGQAPLRAAGLDPEDLIGGAKKVRDGWGAGRGIDALASILDHRVRHPAGAQVVWCYSDGLLPWAAWLQQLECESLGRATKGGGVGELVTVLRGPADQHSVAQLLLDGPKDKRVMVVDYADDGLRDHVGADRDLAAVAQLRAVERDATFDAMRVPALRLLLERRGLESLGGLMMYGLAWTVLLAAHMDVDPYGQPAVEDIKQRVKASLERKRS